MLLAAAGPVSALPGTTAAGLSYPLDGIADALSFEARSMSGGCWLAGLPGFPRYNNQHIHAGIDLRASLGDTIFAVGPGVVDPASDIPHRGYGPGWTIGNVLIVRTTVAGGGTYLTVYGHTQQHLVCGGQTVAAGQPVAQVGPWLDDDGGPHLHLTVRVGELPCQGWGTPTCGATPSRPGAEVAADPAAVVKLGYRDPRWLLAGRVDREMLVGRQDTGEDDARLVARYRQGFVVVPDACARGGVSVVNCLGLPCALTTEAGVWAKRRAGGIVQFFETDDGVRSALLAADAAPEAYWVHGAIGATFWRRGGPERLGYPTAEEQQLGARRRQCFAKAVLIAEEDGATTIIPQD